MSEEITNLVPGETATLTGEGTVTTEGNIETVVTEPAVTEPVVDAPVDAPVEAAPVETPVTEAPVEEQPVVAVAPVEDAAVTPEVSPEQTVVMYNGQAVVKRFGLYDSDGAEQCELADGSTAFVPKSVLGE